MINNIPNLFIVGAAKSGTTSLYHYLKSHSEIYVSPIKEPNYFGKDIQFENFSKKFKSKFKINEDEYFKSTPLKSKDVAFVNTEEQYLKLFSASTSQKYLADFSTSYLYSKYAAREIFEYNNKSKIIILLREPKDRVLSHYFMDLSNSMQENSDILKSIVEDFTNDKKGWGCSHLYIELSMYYEQLKRYIALFPREQILILRFEDMRDNSELVSKQLSHFLDIEINVNNTVFNKTLIPKYKIINHIKRMLSFMPQDSKNKIKNYMSFLLKPRSNVFIPDDVLAYLECKLDDDWMKTKKLLSQFGHNLDLNHE